jgi:hypothetical protein
MRTAGLTALCCSRAMCRGLGNPTAASSSDRRKACSARRLEDGGRSGRRVKSNDGRCGRLRENMRRRELSIVGEVEAGRSASKVRAQVVAASGGWGTAAAAAALGDLTLRTPADPCCPPSKPFSPPELPAARGLAHVAQLGRAAARRQCRRTGCRHVHACQCIAPALIGAHRDGGGPIATREGSGGRLVTQWTIVGRAASPSGEIRVCWPSSVGHSGSVVVCQHPSRPPGSRGMLGIHSDSRAVQDRPYST